MNKLTFLAEVKGTEIEIRTDFEENHFVVLTAALISKLFSEHVECTTTGCIDGIEVALLEMVRTAAEASRSINKQNNTEGQTNGHRTH